MKTLSTTVIGIVNKDKKRAVIGSDGQVTLGNTVLKKNARKIRKIEEPPVLVGFAGSTADSLTLFERFEGKLQEFRGNLKRAVVELAKEWRQDKVLRRLEAFLIILDKENAFLVSGAGDIIEPDDNIVAIGSGAPYALAAARALKKYTQLDERKIVEESLKIASEICVYTNSEVIIEEI